MSGEPIAAKIPIGAARSGLGFSKMEDWRLAVGYRNRAVLLQTIAEETKREDYKEALLSIADHYDDMAETIEQERQITLTARPQ